MRMQKSIVASSDTKDSSIEEEGINFQEGEEREKLKHFDMMISSVKVVFNL
jgi:hypothetical protein